MDSMSWCRCTLRAACLLVCAVFCMAAAGSSDDREKPSCDGETPSCEQGEECDKQPTCDHETPQCEKGAERSDCGEEKPQCDEKPACDDDAPQRGKCETCDKKPTCGCEEADVQFMSPPNQAVLMSGNFDVICKTNADTFEVNGETHQWDAFGPPVRVARLRLPPGIYEILVGKNKVNVVVAMNEEEHDGPEEWLYHDKHRIKSSATRCAVCHETQKQDEQTFVGDLKSYEACMECHTEIDFEVTHSHILEPLQECRMCHALHGSPNNSLLKAPMRTLCEKCHDPDH